MVNTFRAKGPLLVFGGPYSNLEAMRALLDEAASRGIHSDHMICTGDVVAYAADAAATVDLVRKSIPNVVMGNCEESLAADLADCGCGFPAGSACERLSAAWFAHAARQMDSDARYWIARLPKRIDIEIGEYRLAVIHGGIKSINQFIFASSAASIKAKELDLAGVDGIIGGHCGLPFSQSVNGRLWHNSGAIGMPANDGTPRVWFSILTAEPSGLRIEHCALDYNFSAATDKMRSAGLPDGYANALESGLWPSCDVLPLKELRARGFQLEEASVIWRPQPSIERPGRRSGNIASEQLWPIGKFISTRQLAPGKFAHPHVTATGEPRATVPLRRLQTVWFNTGTLCNISCRNCYIESSPKNDRLVYLSRSEVASYLDEIERDKLGTEEIGFTGGEPFMNPDFLEMLEDSLSRGFRVLALTNAMRPMQRAKARLVDLNSRYGGKLTIRVSLDHFNPERHEDERGPRTYKPTLDGLTWLAHAGLKISVAGRTMWGEDIRAERD
ncbi:MAG: radical SAM protein, partial [Methyloceanibacter sp.]